MGSIRRTRLIGYGSKHYEVRNQLSPYGICVYDALRFKDTKELAKATSPLLGHVYHAVRFRDDRPLSYYLSSNQNLSADEEKLLQEYQSGQFKPLRGTPKHKSIIRADWLADGADNFAGIHQRWRKLKSGRTKYLKKNGGRVTAIKVREEICRRVAARLNHADEWLRLYDYLDRSRKRR